LLAVRFFVGLARLHLAALNARYHTGDDFIAFLFRRKYGLPGRFAGLSAALAGQRAGLLYLNEP
jgi:hypothetical protein